MGLRPGGARGEGHEQFVLAQHGRRDTGSRRQTRRVVADDSKVQRPVLEAFHQRVGPALDRDDLDIRLGVLECPQGGGHERDVGSGEGSRVQQSAVPRVQHGQLPGRPGQPVEHLHGVPVQCPAAGIEPYAPREPFEQRAARLLFQRGDPPGDRGLGVIEPDRRLGERSGLCHGHEQPKCVDLEHVSPLSRSSGHRPSSHNPFSRCMGPMQSSRWWNALARPNVGHAAGLRSGNGPAAPVPRTSEGEMCCHDG